MAASNMNNLTTLIKRLEAATSRLEDIASSTLELPQPASGFQHTVQHTVPHTVPHTAPHTTPSPRSPASAVSQLPAPAAAPAPPAEPIPESVQDFDVFIKETVEKYAQTSKAIGGLLADQAAYVVDGFKEQRKFLLVASKSKKPDLSGAEMSIYQDLLKPINDALMSASNIKDSNRGSPVFPQLSTVAEGIMVLAWITVDVRPYKHVEECLGSAQFFGNRVLKEVKDKEPQQVEWVQSFYEIFKVLQEYVKRHCPNGPWNPTGRPVLEVLKSVSAAAPPRSSGAPPPPPPPGPAPLLQINEQKTDSAPAGGLGAVFSELNKGEAVTQGLRKVDKSEMTHKNPALRNGSVPDGDRVRGKSPAPGKKPKPESMRVKKPPKKELEGNKWTIENFEKVTEPIEIEASLSHSILISKCTSATIIIRGKANAVTVENTSRVSLVVDTLVSAVDVVKSANFALQVLGSIPTVMMDQVDGAQVYFSKASIAAKIFSSKSANINLNVISGPDEDYVELPLPSQLCSYFDEAKGEVINEIVSHAG